jgi:hypothetical protein
MTVCFAREIGMRANRLTAFFIGFTSFALTTGCGTTDQVTRMFDDSDTVASPFDDLLVVGVHPDANTRREFEAAFVREIRAAGVNARYSLEFMPSSEPISRESLVSAAEQADAEAVVITRLVGFESRTEIKRGRSTVEAQRRNDIPLADFFRYEYAEYTDPMMTAAVATIVLETDVYRVADEQQVWRAQSQAIDTASVFEAVTSEAEALTRALASDGLIP